jgi:hypothetical protein
MNKKKHTISSSLLEAMEDYAKKIEKIKIHDPGNKVELACLYSGISGISECVTALRKNGFISDPENVELQQMMEKLYSRCTLDSS